MLISSFIKKIVRYKLRDFPPGIFSVCSANPFVLKASMNLAKSSGFPLLIESTCNQVNQHGGYMQLKPAGFVKYINKLKTEIGLSPELVFLGGDHLGPSAWQHESATSAMEKSIELVRQYIRAGYKKIHLDASMACRGDEDPLPKEIIATREAQLCSAAVKECIKIGQQLSGLVFVVGTEVPAPGGSSKNQESIEASSIHETEENIHHTRNAFIKYQLEKAWEQTFAFVVQPGVEFSDNHIHDYDQKKAAGLSHLIEEYDNLIFEAHSTDFQSGFHLKQMVKDHFAILKVGPALTFAMREAVFALEFIERELINEKSNILSNMINILDKVMVSNPEHWEKYYSVDPLTGSIQRKYSFLDRCRYYWTFPEVEKSVRKLVGNLSRISIPFSLISQFLPNQFIKVKEGQIKNHPQDLILGKITDVLQEYLFACDPQQKQPR